MSAVKDAVIIARDVSQVATGLIKVQLDQLAEAYRKMLIKVLTWVLVLLAALLMAMGGLGMIVWGVYQQMALAAGPLLSALVMGTLLLSGAVILFLIARGLLKD